MQIFSLPPATKALIFDIDNTLYSSNDYVRSQTEHLIRRFAEWKGVSYKKGAALIEGEKQRYATANEGKQTSLGNIMLALGVSLEENARWRDELFQPEEYLKPDTETVDAVGKLALRFALAAVTNNTVAVGRRTLTVLGLSELIPFIVGLDTCLVSKPAREPFQTALRFLQVPAEKTVSIGDRYAVDIEIPLAMGMGGILVERFSDLYELPELLGNSEV